MVVEGKWPVVEKPKAVVKKSKAVVAPPKAVVAPPKAIVAKPKAIVIPSVHEGGGGASHPSFPSTQEIIGASPTTREVLVRDIETREQSWQPATKDQIIEVTQAVKRVEAGERIVYPSYKPAVGKSKGEAEEEAKKTGGIAYVLPSGFWGVKPLVEEPVIPPEKPVLQLIAKERKFTLPPGIPRKNITFTAKGEVEWYEKAGVRYYAPASEAWKEGFRTSTQRLSGDPAPYVAITTPVGDVIHITRPEATKLSRLKGEDLFLAQIDTGIIPKGSEYDPKTGGFFSPEIVKAKKEFETGLKSTSPDLYKLYRKEGIEGYNKEIERQLAELAVLEGELKETFPDLHKVYKEEGIEAYNKEVERLQKEITAHNARIEATIVSLKPFTDDKGGVNLFMAITSGISSEDLKMVGFEDKDIDNAVKGVAASHETGVALPGEKFWQHRTTGELYTDQEFKQLVANYDAKVNALIKAGEIYSKEWQELGEHPTALVTLSAPSGKRLGIETVGFIIPPARAALPETTIRDISAAEWVLGAVNTALIGAAFVPGALLGSLSGKIALKGLYTAGAGALGYEVGKHWGDLTPVQKVIGVGGTLLYALPMLTTVARGVKITSVKVPVKAGVYEMKPVTGELVPTTIKTPAWKGLTVFQNPIIGRSGGQWVIGARNITLPEARLILEGYHPQAMLETKVFTNPSALAKAGFSETQIKYLTDTLKSRNLFAGKEAPFLSKEALIEPTARLDADEIAVLLRQIQKWNKGIKQVDLLYGSPTIKAQLAPELRGWRQVHDWDISTTMSPEKTAAFTKEIMLELQKLPGKHLYRINPKTPTLLEKKIKGKWEHIGDIHSHEVTTALSGKEIPTSALDTTGQYSYGRMVAEPAITVKYPGGGQIDIMKLSESGVRKADTILRVRQTEAGTAFRPPERGIARPGVPKDAADYYVILKTFKGDKIADKWARAWAKSMGYTEAELAKLMPTLKKAMLKVASETPSNLIGYRITPASTAKVPAGASPTITIHIPASLGASVSGRLGRSISTPVSPSVALRKIASPSLLPSVAKSVPASKAISPSLKASISAILKSVSPKIKPSPVVKPSPAIPPSLASAKLSPAPSPSLAPSPSPAPSPAPSPSPLPSPKPSPKPTAKPSPAPSPAPSPVPEKPPPPPPPPPPPLRGASNEEKREAIKKAKGAIAWRHGELHGKDVFHVGMYPYTRKENYITLIGKKPAGATIIKGPGSARQTIKLLYGRAPPRTVKGDIGFFDFSIKPVGRKKVDIEFTPDPRMQTRGDITIGRGAPPITERPTGLGRGKAGRITPKRPRLGR